MDKTPLPFTIHDLPFTIYVFMVSIKPTVMKFGGTSVEDASAFERAGDIVARQAGARPVVVVSAMSRVTDALLASVRTALESDAETAAHALAYHFERHLDVAHTLLSTEAAAGIEAAVRRARVEMAELLQSVALRKMSLPLLQDVIVSYGERLSATLLAAVLQERGLPSRYVDARLCIMTDAEHGSAAPLRDQTERCTRAEIGPLIESGEVPVLGGFIAATPDGETTTLGRGGSDYTAALVGASLNAQEIQIWTDVTGVLTADPRVVQTARTIPRLSYREAAELAYFGAKVLHPKTIQPAIEKGIRVRICNSRAPEEAGTLVETRTETLPHPVKAIAHKTAVTTVQVTSARMLGAYGFLRAIFEVFARHRTVVDVVTTSEVSVSLSLDDASALSGIVKELQQLGTVEVETNRAIICIVGEGLRDTPGIAARVFTTISDINISLISQGASRINLTFVVDEARAREAVSRLHEVLFNISDEAEVMTLESKASSTS